ncbi:MAG TPA: carbohydrate porin [Kofleriaceae bacterium]|nr:carbohydrate porin [Kofleriaceae bacterium]
MPPTLPRSSASLAIAAAMLLSPPAARAGDPRDDGATLLPHPDAAWWLSGQINLIGQAQPGFHAPYTGDNSLRSDDHAALSTVETVFAGYEVTPVTAIVVAGESAGGGGLSNALGLGGFTNLDVVRNPSLGVAPYVARAFIDQIIPLSSEWRASERDALHVLRELPTRRIEIRAGKLATAESFDLNAIGSDSHLQFMNWTVNNNGAYDYAADTRGYTLGAIAEYAQEEFAVRFGELLMPKVANGNDYDFDIANARGENLELEYHDRIAGRAGTVRVLGFLNHARMGNYVEANAPVLVGVIDRPDITASRQVGRTKYGFGLNAEHEIVDGVRGFLRVGWSDGKNESFAFTEVDNTFELGGDVRGTWWGRGADKLGLAAVTNGLSDGHARYLQLGGKGFLLGDGNLHYARETVVEAYYTARVYRGVSLAADGQVIVDPGFNADRGPVAVGSLRLHVEI